MRRAQNATASSSKLERPDKNDDDCEYKVSLRVGIIHLSLDISKMITMVLYENETTLVKQQPLAATLLDFGHQTPWEPR